MQNRLDDARSRASAQPGVNAANSEERLQLRGGTSREDAAQLRQGDLGERAQVCDADADAREREEAACKGASREAASTHRLRTVSLPPEIRAQLGISEREHEVMELFAQGRSASWIADRLILSTSTVRSHIRAVYMKTGVHSRQELQDFLAASEQ